MSVGLGMVALELTTNLVDRRLGTTGHLVVVTCGIFFSIWGLKELLAAWWPSLSRSTFGRNRFLLPIEGQIYLGIMFVVFVGSMLGRSNPLMLVFSLMAGPFIVNGWLTRTMLKRLSVTRIVPERVMAGEPTSVEITLSNGKTWLSAWLMTAVDRVSNEREALFPSVLFTRVPPSSARSGHYPLRLEQRGVYEAGPLQVNTRFPLGLVERGLILNVVDRIIVYPRIGRLAPRGKTRLQQATQLSNTSLPQGGLYNDEFHKLRDFRRGDELRSIHWKTSARRSELMVREFRQSRDQNLALLLDAWLPLHPAPADHAAVELAISLAATITADLARQGREAVPYFAALGSQLLEWGGASGSHRLETLLEGLALLQPATTAEASPLLEHCAPHVTGRHSILLVTSRPTDVLPSLSRWASEQPQSRSRLLRIVDVLSSRSPEAETLVTWS